MPRHLAFETAAARRRRDPIIWTIDDTEVHLVASIDLADLADLVTTLQGEPDGASPMAAAVARRDALIGIIRRFVTDGSQAAWDTVQRDIDVSTLGEMCSELIMEYSGAGNPTQPSSSSPGSETPGTSSTDGAAAEDSTPSASPQIEP